MVSFPPCKINLGLRILSKRQDGYHNIDTCFYPVPWTDILEILPSEKIEFHSTGILIPGDPSQNLCLKAHHLMKADFDIPSVRIHLHKIIPMGAGLGGGSADGAYALKSLNSIFNLKLSESQLMDYASHLGSDCAFFIQDGPMVGKERGNVLRPAGLSLKGYHLVLIKPDIHVSTVDAYAGVAPKEAASIEEIIKDPVISWKHEMKNDFEDSVFNKYPVIREIKRKLYEAGAIYASMSGSGSAVYGIFKDQPSISGLTLKVDWSGQL